jgi:putative SOS response-associated peptidase YedK
MCGRFTLAKPAGVIAEAFAVEVTGELPPRYNIAPTQAIAVVRAGERGGRTLAMLRWGLVPSWAKDEAIGGRLINARGETVAEKPAFRAALAARRCLILADGFYEWQHLGARKQPYHFRLRSARPFAFAGLWERWGAETTALETCTIITTAANEIVAPVHERMPVILPAEAHVQWLAPGRIDPARIKSMLVPHPTGELIAVLVSSLVNNPTNDDSRCIAAVA